MRTDGKINEHIRRIANQPDPELDECEELLQAVTAESQEAQEILADKESQIKALTE